MQFIENKRFRLFLVWLNFIILLGGIRKIMLINQSQIADLESISLVTRVEYILYRVYFIRYKEYSIQNTIYKVKVRVKAGG